MFVESCSSVLHASCRRRPLYSSYYSIVPCSGVRHHGGMVEQEKKWWLRKAALQISLADRNGLKNLSWKMFSACMKFGGNPCREVDTLGFYTHTHTDTHIHEWNYILLAVIPVLCTGRPYFLFTLNRLFQILCLALLSHATAVSVCTCVTHHLPFYWFWNLLPFLSHFPTRLKARNQLATGGSFELDISEHKASLFRKAFVPSFLKISEPFFE